MRQSAGALEEGGRGHQAEETEPLTGLCSEDAPPQLHHDGELVEIEGLDEPLESECEGHEEQLGCLEDAGREEVPPIDVPPLPRETQTRVEPLGELSAVSPSEQPS